MRDTIKLSLTVSVAMVMGIASMWSWNYGLSRADRAEEQLAYNEAAIAVCVDDYRAINKVRQYDMNALDVCTKVMLGEGVL